MKHHFLKPKPKQLLFFALFTSILSLLVIFYPSIKRNNALALENGLARTPPMGWNSYNCFHLSISESVIKQIADTLVSTGMRDAGYKYLNMDAGWATTGRDANGVLQADSSKFPNGIKSLADYVHSKGLKLGIYQSRGSAQCGLANVPGMYGYFQTDLNTWASWGIDYFKVDNCSTQGGNREATAKQQYTDIGTALANCGRPMVYSICEWGLSLPCGWAQNVGSQWRTFHDINNSWSGGILPPTGGEFGVSIVIDYNEGLDPYGGPGHWNDPDMLEVGNGKLTNDESISHFSMWALMAAPLIAGNDIRSMTQQTKDILMNSEVIAVDQDALGKGGWKVAKNGNGEVWMRPLADGGKAVVLFNRGTSAINITANWADIGLVSGTSATVRDLWAKADRGSFTNSYTANSIPAHGCVMIKIQGANVNYDYASDLFWDYRANGVGIAQKDRSNGTNGADAAFRNGNTITLNGVTYTKGIGVHAASEIRINMAGKYTRFTSDIGVDDEMTSGGSVVFQVWTDGIKIYDSGVMTASTATKNVDVDVTGKNELKLIVTDGGDGITSDHADWAGAMLSMGAAPPTPTSTKTPTPTVTPSSGGNGAIFYQNTSYGGTATQVIPPGNYTLAQLQAYGFVDNWASSCKTGGYTVIMYDGDNFSGTSWTLTSDTTSFINLSPSANDLVTSVKIQTGGGATPTATVTPIQTPTATPTSSSGISSGHTYILTVKHSAKAVVVQSASTANSAAVIQYTYADNGVTNDEWTLTDLGTGYYEVINANSGKAMAVQGASTATGALIIQYTFGTSQNDEWAFVNAGSGYYYLVNHKSGLYLDLPGSSTSNSVQFDQAASTGGDNQKFSLTYLR